LGAKIDEKDLSIAKNIKSLTENKSKDSYIVELQKKIQSLELANQTQTTIIGSAHREIGHYKKINDELGNTIRLLEHKENDSRKKTSEFESTIAQLRKEIKLQLR
jgi:hypothetical protein